MKRFLFFYDSYYIYKTQEKFFTERQENKKITEDKR